MLIFHGIKKYNYFYNYNITKIRIEKVKFNTKKKKIKRFLEKDE